MTKNSISRPIIFAVLAATAILNASISDSNAKDQKSKNRIEKASGEVIFQQYCASCHQSGGNATVPSKTVAGSTKLGTLATFKDYLNNPLGHMPYYKNVIEDKTTIDALYKYCKTLKKENIKQVSHKPQESTKI